MNNFINVRIDTSHHHKEKNDIKHNVGTATKKSIDENSKFSDYEETVINFQNEKPSKQLSIWRAEHNKRYKENRYKTVNGEKRLRNENLTNSNSTILNGIISFSEAINQDLGTKYSKKEFEDACVNAVKKIAEFLDTEIMYCSFHYQEKTPHIHYHFRNFDNEGNSIFYKNRNTEQLEVLQDLAFQELKGLGMERGLKKNFTNKTHQTTKAYFAKEFKNMSDDLREQVKLLKDKRKEVSSLDISIEEKKVIYDEITRGQKVFRKLDKILAKAENGGAITEEEQKTFLAEMPIFGKYLTVEKKREFIGLVESSVIKKSQTDLK